MLTRISSRAFNSASARHRARSSASIAAIWRSLFSYVSCQARVPPDHPLRLIRAMVDEALDVLSPEFDGLYARVGRPGVAPETLLRALLLQAFYSIRSERQLMEQLD